MMCQTSHSSTLCLEKEMRDGGKITIMVGKGERSIEVEMSCNKMDICIFIRGRFVSVVMD